MNVEGTETGDERKSLGLLFLSLSAGILNFVRNSAALALLGKQSMTERTGLKATTPAPFICSARYDAAKPPN